MHTKSRQPFSLSEKETTCCAGLVDGKRQRYTDEIGDFRYILTTNKSRYAQGEDVYITFRKRNISDNTLVLRYMSDQLFDFYISDALSRTIAIGHLIDPLSYFSL